MKPSSKSKFGESVGQSGETFSHTASDELKRSSCRMQCVEDDEDCPLRSPYMAVEVIVALELIRPDIVTLFDLGIQMIVWIYTEGQGFPRVVCQ